jgi:hypothetical protein
VGRLLQLVSSTLGKMRDATGGQQHMTAAAAAAAAAATCAPGVLWHAAQDLRRHR